MLFTEKEIQLAKMLKEDGLKWKPAIGDWYLGPFTKEPNTGYLHPELVDSAIWLPLWNQCREILHNNGYLIELTESTQEIILVVMTYDGGNIFKGDTDLEAMYEAIGYLSLTGKEVKDEHQNSNVGKILV